MNQESIVLEPMNENTVHGVAALERRCFSSPWSLESLREELHNPLAVVFTAAQGDALLGYIGMHYVLDEGFINNVAVDPAHRRKGVGMRLLERLLEECRSLGLNTVTLEVRASNEAAISLYQRIGFAGVGLRKGYYVLPAEDAVLMTLEL